MLPRKAVLPGDPGTLLRGRCGGGSRLELQPHTVAIDAFCRDAQINMSSRFDPIHSNSIHKRQRDRGILTQSGHVPFHPSVPYKHAASWRALPAICSRGTRGTSASPRSATWVASEASAASLLRPPTPPPAPSRFFHEQSGARRRF